MTFEDNSGLSPEVNAAIRKSEIDGGIWWKDVELGQRALVRTKSRTYTVEQREDGTYISGHPQYCPKSVKARIHGSTWGGSMLKIGWIGVGMNMEFSIVDHIGNITTSTVQDVILEPM